MSLGQTLYNALFKRTSTFALTCITGAFVLERVVSVSVDSVFDHYNEGKQWKDVKKRLDLS